MLTKGLIGVAFVAVTYGCYTIVTRRLSLAVCLRCVVALAIAAMVAATWYIPVEIKHPGFLHYYFIERHFLGFATATQAHGEAPWWYYLPLVLGGGLPWIGYLPVTIGHSLARRSQHADSADKTENSPPSAMILLFCWLIGCTVLLSVAHSKLVTYIWPVFPAVAVLAAEAWAKFLDGVLAQMPGAHCLGRFFSPRLPGRSCCRWRFSWCIRSLPSIFPARFGLRHSWLGWRL